jgi:hypothetical protein
MTEPVLLQAVSLLGAALVLAAYAGAQAGRMDPRRVPGASLNLAGSAMLFASAISPPNYGVLVLEGAWAVISLGSLLRALRRPPQPPATP